MPAESKGLAGEWDRRHGTWREAAEALFRERDNTHVRVLSWGPSDKTQWFAKRKQIAEDLTSIPHTSVATSEELFDREPRYREYETLDAEEMQASDADVIICLLVDDDKVTGGPTEIVRFAPHPAVRQKLRVVLPRVFETRGALMLQPTKGLPETQRFSYSQKQYESCDDIRAECRKWIEAVRREKHLRDKRTRRGG